MTKRVSTIDLLRRHSLPSLIQGQLEEMILAGSLAPGSQLTEIPLSLQLGVSRGPVREAFRGLEEKGLVRVEKNRGVFVRTISPAEADQIYEVRVALELLVVAKLAADPGRLAQAKFEALLDKAERMASKGDFAACHACNVDFHDHLVQGTGNAALLDTYRRLVGELSLFRHRAHARIRNASSLRASVVDHRSILSAILAGDAAAARRRIRRHVEASRNRTQRLLAAAGTSND
jgi:DNA-binding GntR family transcriptional regulator